MTDRVSPLVTTPVVLVSPRVASIVAPVLAQMLRQWRVRDGGTPDAELLATVEAMAALARAHAMSSDKRADCGMPGMPMASNSGQAEGTASTLGTVSVTEAATVLGISPRAVRGRLERKTLPGRLVGGVWNVWIPEEALS